jgi:hypothetical protein
LAFLSLFNHSDKFSINNSLQPFKTKADTSRNRNSVRSAVPQQCVGTGRICSADCVDLRHIRSQSRAPMHPN